MSRAGWQKKGSFTTGTIKIKAILTPRLRERRMNNGRKEGRM
jgi:hypothetical protein